MYLDLGLTKLKHSPIHSKRPQSMFEANVINTEININIATSLFKNKKNY